jgi:hypothetical protein
MRVHQFNKVQANFLCFKKSLAYEWDYCLRKLKPLQLIIFIILLTGAIVTGLSDTKSFFTDIADYIPKELTLLRDKQTVLILSASIISILYFLAWFYELTKASNEASELADITQNYLVPLQVTALKRFRTSIRRNFGLSERIRISIFVPVRRGFLCWRFQMVCGTENIYRT